MSISYIATPPGLLKLVEAVLCLGGFISALIPYDLFTPLGGGWTQFVTITALFGVIGILIANLALAHKLPPAFPLLVLIFYLVYDMFLLIAGILTAVRAGQIYQTWIILIRYLPHYPYRSVAACAFFVLAAFFVFLVDTIFSFQAYRNGETNTQTSTSHSATTTTTVASSKTTVVVS